MHIENALKKRSHSKCELCSKEQSLRIYLIPPAKTQSLDTVIMACDTCVNQIEQPETTDPNHWRCLNDSMWSEHQAVQVMAWRMLSRLKAEGWPQNLLDMMYMEEDVLKFAQKTGEGMDKADAIIHRDVNGVVLNAGDSVVLIKDLKVKGSSLIAKQGVAVRRISLDPENEKYIEGKVEGQQIVIITDYVKKI